MLKISAVLLNWKRPHNMAAIVQSLRAVPEVDEIVVWDNSGVLDDIPGVDRIHRSPENICTLGRFVAAKQARNPVVVTQDDDVLVHNIQEVIRQFEEHPGHIVAGLKPAHFRVEAHKKPFLQVGWGSCFRREWVAVLDHWRDAYGEDELLRRKADRIFTIIQGNHHPIHADVTPLTDPNGRPSESSPDALYRRSDHYRLTDEATRKAVELRDRLRMKGQAC